MIQQLDGEHDKRQGLITAIRTLVITMPMPPAECLCHHRGSMPMPPAVCIIIVAQYY